MTTAAKVLPFESSAEPILAPSSGFNASVDQNFTGIKPEMVEGKPVFITDS